MSSAYIDDSCLVARSFQECLLNVRDTLLLMDELGFTIHLVKSCLKPSHILVYLGFILNSLQMTVSLTKEKADKIISMCKSLLNKKACSIRELAEVIGSLVAAEPGVELAPLHYKSLEHEKDRALKSNKGNYEASLLVTNTIKEDLKWWIEHLPSATKHLEIPTPLKTIYTDSSDFARGLP